MATYMRARARRCGTVASLCPRGALSYARRASHWHAAARDYTWQTSALRGKAHLLRLIAAAAYGGPGAGPGCPSPGRGSCLWPWICYCWQPHAQPITNSCLLRRASGARHGGPAGLRLSAAQRAALGQHNLERREENRDLIWGRARHCGGTVAAA